MTVEEILQPYLDRVDSIDNLNDMSIVLHHMKDVLQKEGAIDDEKESSYAEERDEALTFTSVLPESAVLETVKYTNKEVIEEGIDDINHLLKMVECALSLVDFKIENR